MTHRRAQTALEGLPPPIHDCSCLYCRVH